MDDDIEILDIFDEEKKKPPVKVEKKEIKKEEPIKTSTKKKKRKLKTRSLQIAFCSISALFIFGCIIFYGSRFIKYYRIYNPKVDSSDGSVLLAQNITGNSEIVYQGSGLYSSSGNYIYKGDVKDNYIMYNNMLWRILKINVDNSIDIILDDYINILPWNKEVTNFASSSINDYLNKDFLNNLDKDLLVKVNYCEDKIEDLNSITCDKKNNEQYVKLLDITSFLNSVKEKKSFLVSDDEIFWLSDYNTDKVWHTNSVNVSQSDSNIFYEVRPVVKLKNTVTYSKGEGKKDNPYIVGDNKIGLGSIVKLGDDKWIIYDMGSNVRLMREKSLEKTMMFDKESLDFDKSSLNEYLNKEYLESLSYKDKIISNDYYTGKYSEDLEDVKKSKVNVKVGIPSILDIKLNSEVNGYFTSTSNDESIYVYENPLRQSRSISYRNIRPCITLKKDYIDKLQYNDGVWEEK